MVIYWHYIWLAQEELKLAIGQMIVDDIRTVPGGGSSFSGWQDARILIVSLALDEVVSNHHASGSSYCIFPE